MSEPVMIQFTEGVLGAAVRMATPILLGTMGEILTEKAGILNLGIEGIMLMGALTGFLATIATGSLWAGVLAACIVGMIFGLLMSLLTVKLGLSHHVAGLGITLLCTGLAMYIYRLVVGSPTVPPTVHPFTTVPIPLLSKIPFIGNILFNQYVLTYVAFLSVLFLSFLLNRTSAGLAIRTVGDNPFAADTAGIHVTVVRTLCVTAGAGIMGVAGAFMTLAHQNMFLSEVVGGRGWVCIAMVIFGNWNPYVAALGALGFGLMDGLQLRLQNMGLSLPFDLFLLIPYLMTLIALIIMSGRSGAPLALLQPYRREDKV
ncbi:MAG TPA: ABC transporter permease [Treponema sp.]|nr:ABC transporter permease [Treponema sp.]